MDMSNLAVQTPPYLGMFLRKTIPDETRRKKWKKRHGNKIFLYHPEIYDTDKVAHKLTQIVDVYKHTFDDFEFNAKHIIEHYKKYYGSTSIWMYTLGQTIKFRVYPGQEEPFELSLFAFYVNYTLLAAPIICHADMRNWHPYDAENINPKIWEEKINQHIYMVRNRAGIRLIGECADLSKYLLKIFIEEVGDRIGLSISNNEFIEAMKRNDDVRESITCTFPIPKDISPTDLESLTMKRTMDMLKFIGDQS